jgi:membrane-associated PAP2 superfamily phosphatase
MPSLAASPSLFRRAVEQLRRDRKAWAFAVALGLLAFTSLVFLVVPQLDIAVSDFFYLGSDGFLDQRYGLVETIRGLGGVLTWALVLGVLAPPMIKIMFPWRPILLPPRATLFVLSSYALGPGLLVNGILKEHWGRARPREILDFGGTADFSPVWWISDQCERNCSFVSGEAAAAFWLVALVFVVPRDWRSWTAVATVAAAATISFTRVAAGAHFLSDVLIAWLLTLLVMIVLNHFILKMLPTTFDAAVDGQLARAGQALRGPGGPTRHSPSS